VNQCESIDREGYTLLEMLVVLGLLAIVLSISLPSLHSNRGLDGQAHEIVALLRAARIAAINQNKETTLEADLARRKIAVTDRKEDLSLSNDIALTMLTARQEVQNERGYIRFFPDGSSTGGSITLRQGKREIAVQVQWLSGRISKKVGYAN
jgi:general secretion pathway protein H